MAAPLNGVACTIFAMVQARPGITGREIAAEFERLGGVGVAQQRNYLRALAHAGYVRREGHKLYALRNVGGEYSELIGGVVPRELVV
jgi:hypothetical protein